MVVHTRARGLLEWLVPLSAKFPREHRQGVARHMVGLALRVHDELIAARHGTSGTRHAALLQADIALDQLRQYLHLAWRWQWISEGQLQHAATLCEELGRLVGGWLRAVGTVEASGRASLGEARGETDGSAAGTGTGTGAGTGRPASPQDPEETAPW
jgi:hypothetical protein